MELRKKILLVNPPSGAIIREDRCQTPIDGLRTVAMRTPIDLLYIAAMLEQAGCECRICDYPAYGKSWDDFKTDIETFNPDFLVINATTPSLKKDMMAAEMAKKVMPHIVTIAKGAHFNILDVDTLEQFPFLDIVTRGEYELTFKELGEGKDFRSIDGITYRNVDAQIVRNPDRGFCESIDSFPFPARHLIDNHKYIRPDTEEPQTTIITNRGCPYGCIFCLAGQVAGYKNRVRSVPNIIAEIEECIAKHNIRNFLFRSDLFTGDRDWVMHLCNEIIRRELRIQWVCNSRVDTIDENLLARMKEAHCWMVAFGIETGNEEMLAKMKKKATLDLAREAIEMTRKAKILTSVYFLIGLPWDSEETLADNVRFAKETDPDIVEFFFVYPFPGTELYEIAQQEHLLKPNEIPTDAYSKPAMDTLFLTKADLIKWRRISLRRFYLRPKIVLRTLAHARSLRELKNYIKYGLIQLSDILFRRG